jgi:hypothetical protein
MPRKKTKIILDFDGTLTDEVKQADELSSVAKKMLAEDILGQPISQIEKLYEKVKKKILATPHKYSWQVNGLPATYAYEGAYLLNTAIIQQILQMNDSYKKIVKDKFPANHLDSYTLCANKIFHDCSLHVSPHFLEDTKELLCELISHKDIEPVILTNSESKKIAKNLQEIEIGEKGKSHTYKYEIEILGDTRQYHMDATWNPSFNQQVLNIDDHFSVDLRRPIYHAALEKVGRENYEHVIIAADGFSLAGAMPLVMDINFVLMKTSYTPKWSEQYVKNHSRGMVASSLQELHAAIRTLLQ